MNFKCSECNGEVVKEGRKMVCKSCKRTVKLSYGKIKIQKEVDMNETTHDKEVLFG